MTSDNNALRPEARPIPYWQHHKRAKEALNFIIRILKGAAGSVRSSKGTKGDTNKADVDTNRASRIVFISGEPGSGKSTLYLTLRAMLSWGETYYKGYEDTQDIDALKNVRWLEPLDLEVAGDEGENLLAAVLVRLFRNLEGAESSPVHSGGCEGAIKELEDLATDIGIAWEGNLRARAAALDPDTFSAEVIRTQGARLGINKRLKEALDKLAEHKCYGCDENTFFVLPVDDFYLKPTASLQLLRLLRMISIPRLFFLVMGDIKTVEALFIEKSLADWTDVAGTRLFATQTDRLDEALTRARELRARYLRKLLPPLQRADIEAMDWFEALDFKTTHTDSDEDTINPNDTLEKLLDEVTLDESSAGGSASETLRAFLISPALLSTDSPEWKAEKLKRQGRARGEAKDQEEEDGTERSLKKSRSAYTALQIMDATPREIMDFGFALSEVRRKKQEEAARKKDGFKPESPGTVDSDKVPQLLLSVRNIVNLVREEQSFLNEDEQEVLEGILPTRTYYPEDASFDMKRLCLEPTYRTWEPKEEQKENSVLLWYREHRSWDLSVNRNSITDSNSGAPNLSGSNNGAESLTEDEGAKQADKSPYAKLPPRQTAWYILLHDLASKWNQDSVNGNLIKRLCKDLDEWELLDTGNDPPLKQSKQRFIPNPKQKKSPDPSDSFIGWAVYLSSGDYLSKGSIYKHLPIPKFKIFRDLDRFLFIWSSGLKWLKKFGVSEANKISSIWALAGWTVLTDTERTRTYEKFAREGDKWFEAFDATRGSFTERFGELKRKLGQIEIAFQPPFDKNDEITLWLGKLDELPEQFKSEQEDSTKTGADGSERRSTEGRTEGS